MGRYWTIRVPIGELRLKRKNVKALAVLAASLDERYKGFRGVDIEPPRAVLAFEDEADAIRAGNLLKAGRVDEVSEVREEELEEICTRNGVV